MDADQLASEMRRKLRDRGGDWLTFARMADQICGDRSMAMVLVAIARQCPDLVISRDEKFVKLQFDESHFADTANPDDGDHRIAARAVRDYAEQLTPVILEVRAVGPGIRVLERFVHAIVIADSDDDLADNG
jgi:hypothetical protein